MKCPHCGGELPPDKGRSKGGKARWKGTSKKSRSEAASKAAKARWEKPPNADVDLPPRNGPQNKQDAYGG